VDEIPTEVTASPTAPNSGQTFLPWAASWPRAAAAALCLALAVAAFGLFSRRPPPPAPLATPEPLAVPVTLFDEQVDLAQGESRNWSFTLPKPHTLAVAVDSRPEPVVVYLVDAAHWEEFSDALSTGKMTQRMIDSLPDSTTRHMEKTQALGAGEWHLAVFRPKASTPAEVAPSTRVSASATAR
jgi:hypothetical protein